jgi:hypothetical protein
MVEKDFRELIKIGEIDEELTSDEFLFYPFSVTMDAQDNLYIYDLMQAKIIKLDDSFKFVKSWGRVGEGPGEFSGTGRGRPVFLNVGPDGKLYAHDLSKLKVLVYTTDGKFLRQLKLGRIARFDKPISDKSGSIIRQEFKKDRLIIFNENKSTLFSILKPKKKKEYLFAEPKIAYNKGRAVMRPGPLYYSMDELCMRLIVDGKLLLYFMCSSKLYVVKDGKKLLEKYLWPREAVKRIKERYERNEYGYRCLFGGLQGLFTDNDDKTFFYLNFGAYKEKKVNCYYKFNLDGELVSVLYMDYSKPNNSSRLLFKQNNLFIGKHGEQLYIYIRRKNEKAKSIDCVFCGGNIGRLFDGQIPFSLA